MSSAPRPPAPVVRSLRDARPLSPEHTAQLRGSGLTDESIAGNRFYSEGSAPALGALLNHKWHQSLGAGLVIPFFVPTATDTNVPPFFHRVRPDHPRTNKEGKAVKYEQPMGVGIAPYFPFRSREQRRYADIAIPLLFTEGEKKGALLDQLGYAVIAGTGVSCFHDVQYRTETGGDYRLHEMIARHVAIKGRDCVVVFDSDQVEKAGVQRAAGVLAGMLLAAGAASVRNALIPTPEDAKGPKGIDDYYLSIRDAGDTVDDAAAAAAVHALVTDAAPITPARDDADAVVNAPTCEQAPLSPRLRIPYGYQVRRDGSLWTTGERAEQVERAPIFISRLVADLYTDHELVELVYRRDRQWRTTVVTRRTICESRAIVGELAPLGAPVDSGTAAGVVRWLRDFEALNESRLPRSRSVNRCGWHKVDTEHVFVMGQEVLRQTDSQVELVVERSQDKARLSRALSTTGTLEGHIDALMAAWRASPVAAAAICAALLAPLLRVLDCPNFGVHLAGDSSRGKSTMARIATSVFGDPSSEDLFSSWNATPVGHEQAAIHLNDLPNVKDEAGVTDPKMRDAVIYTIMNGVGRGRGAKEGGLRATDSWRTVLLSTGERLLAEESSATGAQVRVIQLQVRGFGDLDAPGVDAVRRECEAHYGQVGRALVQHLLTLGEAERMQHRRAAKKMVLKFQDVARNSLQSRQAVSWAHLAYAEHIAHTLWGLGDADGGTMLALYRDTGATVQIQTASERALELVRHWVQTEPLSFPKLVPQPSGAWGIEEPKHGTARVVHGYHAAEGVYFLPLSLRTKLLESNMSDRVVLSEWKSQGILHTASSDATSRHTKQVRITGARVQVVAISSQAMELYDYSVDEEWGAA